MFAEAVPTLYQASAGGPQKMRVLSSFSPRQGPVGAFDDAGCFTGNFLVRTGARDGGLFVFSKFEPAVFFDVATDAGGVAVNREPRFLALVA